MVKYVIVHKIGTEVPVKGYFKRGQRELTDIGAMEDEAIAKIVAINLCTDKKRELLDRGCEIGYSSPQSVTVFLAGSGLRQRHEFVVHSVVLADGV